MKVHEAITAVMRDAGPIAKGRQNTAQNYQFRGIDDFYATFEPIMAKHGLFMVPEVVKSSIEERTNKNGTVLRFVMLDVKYRFYGPEGDFIEAGPVPGEAMDSGDKAANKAMSAAQKYLFMQVFCPPTETADDPETESHEVQARPEPAPKERVQQVVELVEAAGVKEWVADQGFLWPWPDAVCDVIERKANAELQKLADAPRASA